MRPLCLEFYFKKKKKILGITVTGVPYEKLKSESKSLVLLPDTQQSTNSLEYDHNLNCVLLKLMLLQNGKTQAS